MEICSVVLTFASLDEILWCDHSNETSSAVLLSGTICHLIFYKMKLESFLNFDLWYSQEFKDKWDTCMLLQTLINLPQRSSQSANCFYCIMLSTCDLEGILSGIKVYVLGILELLLMPMLQMEVRCQEPGDWYSQPKLRSVEHP